MYDPPLTAVRDAVTRALAEDLEPLGDITSAVLPTGAAATGRVVARADGVLAGSACARETLARVDPAIAVDWRLDDGAPLTAGDVIAELRGLLASILTAERTALNFLGHLSGIATLTAAYAQAASPLQVWDTRKTTPGLRALEKAAVRAGGGHNHRGNLSEWVLLKDNHIAGIGITAGVARARQLWPGRTIQTEADTIEQVKEALAAGADIVLLDNMTPDQVRACVELRGTATRPLLEISGGITLANLASYAHTGADYISSGALTHSAPVLDLALDIVPT
jgi:nicotinate-nucleotide pyrophosphorylase (carboxylating)